MLGGLPSEFLEILKDIDKLQYKEEPNYSSYYSLLDSAMKTCDGKVSIY